MRVFSTNWGTGAGSGYPFESMGAVVSVDNVEELAAHNPTPEDFLIIWGGADIHPSLYGRKNVASYVGHAPSVRDEVERDLMLYTVDKSILTLGVCRGAQMACALAGGVLAQDVDHHGWTHDIVLTKTKEKLSTSSVHHQMMVPLAVEHELIAVAEHQMSAQYAGLTVEEEAYINEHGEPEIVWFPKQRFLAVQGHPEFMPEGCAFNKYVRSLIMEKK